MIIENGNTIRITCGESAKLYVNVKKDNESRPVSLDDELCLKVFTNKSHSHRFDVWSKGENFVEISPNKTQNLIAGEYEYELYFVHMFGALRTELLKTGKFIVEE